MTCLQLELPRRLRNPTKHVSTITAAQFKTNNNQKTPLDPPTQKNYQTQILNLQRNYKNVLYV